MIKYLLLLVLTLITTNVFANDNLLTIQQQIERLQREVSDLTQTVFSNENDLSSNNNENNDMVSNLSAIDMRIYDLEKDVKKLTGSFEEIYFQLEDLILKVEQFEDVITSLENNLIEFSQNSTKKEVKDTLIDNTEIVNENSLGSLKITSENNTSDQNDRDTTPDTNATEVNLSPEDEFQSAFDNIRDKNWDVAKNSLINFIEKYPENQLSGSAHYWLGELYILEKEYRDAALVFAEGFQKFPKSMKAPDMLFKLSQALYEVDKVSESCKTLEKLILDYPKNKFIKKSNKQIQEYGCLEENE